MYTYEQNPMLKNEICIYLNDDLVASINKANFDSDKKAFEFALFMVFSMNKNL